ncbi:Anaphase-promoting complex subunit 8 [Porphyridium purpureum]|uniref:Anaphase-promoting complex subunit 8 n=1 Tax=Porphyridium purpureum TaxID=35688 RepID=A0A5J4YW39_PORPP|nr:Anaphase-promoting complex subunit 8 [Porphyridium purpureum]|eukprot:POR0515..scf227_4
MEESEPIRRELRHAVRALSARGLAASARFCAELLASLRSETRAAVSASAVATATSSMSSCVCGDEQSLSELEQDVYLVAKAYLDCREYEQCVHAISDEDDRTHDLLFFMRYYALYLLGEKRRADEMQPQFNEFVSSPLRDDTYRNRMVPEILASMQARRSARDLDPFANYLLGVVLKRERRWAESRKALLRSLSGFPLNWSAWLELSVVSAEMATSGRAGAAHNVRASLDAILDPISVAAKSWQSTSRRRCWELMRELGEARTYAQNALHEDALAKYEALSDALPSSAYVATCLAVVYYEMRDFDQAESRFRDVFHAEPYRLEAADMYSNVLFVKEDGAELSMLAQRCLRLDKYRPETCCVIGNYYALRQQHESAIACFERALKLNPMYSHAWTLIGHEYVELKNTAAAIEAYRRAVDLNPTDFRAWYSLGQAYELLSMPLFALFYFKKGATLCPRDPRMWCAVGHVYEELDRSQDAIRCYTRAMDCSEEGGDAVHRLARLYHAQNRMELAAHYYALEFGRLEEDGDEGPEMAEALLFLAEYECNLAEDADLAESFHMQCDHSRSASIPCDISQSVCRLVDSLTTLQGIFEKA